MKTAFILFLLVLSTVIVRGEDLPSSKISVSLEQQGDLWVGQSIIIVVDLFSPGYFSGAPTFDLPKVPGTLILPPTGSPVIRNEESGGITYVVQRHELMVIPKNAGKITLPPFTVRYAIKRHPLDKTTVPQSVTSTALSFSVTQPPGSTTGENILTSSDLTVEESWKPQPGNQAKTGDTFVRTLKWIASDLPGMAFTPFPTDRIKGLGIYQSTPTVTDTRDRGRIHGERMETLTYVCKTGGSFTIPAHTIRWWNPDSREMQQVDFPSHTFSVPLPPTPPEPFNRKAERIFRHYGMACGCGLISIIGITFFIRATHRFWRRFFRRFLPRHLTPLNP